MTRSIIMLGMFILIVIVPVVSIHWFEDREWYNLRYNEPTDRRVYLSNYCDVDIRWDHWYNYDECVRHISILYKKSFDYVWNTLPLPAKFIPKRILICDYIRNNPNYEDFTKVLTDLLRFIEHRMEQCIAND
jgi:hypothetical protein